MDSIHEQFLIVYGYLHGLWRFRWQALLVAWIISIVGWITVYALPAYYMSKASINIDTSTVMRPLLSGLAVETDPQQEVGVVGRMLLNRANLESVIRDTGLDANIKTPQERERLLQRLAQDIHLRHVGGYSDKSRIYEISYTSKNPDIAYKVVSNFLNHLIEKTIRSGQMDTAMAEEFLDDQISDYEKRLEQDEQRLAEFKKKNAGLMPGEKGGYYQRLQSQQEGIDQTKTQLRLAMKRYDDLRQQLSGEKPLFDTGASAAANKLRAYQEKLDELLTQYTEDHPDVKAMRARIADLRASMNTNDPDLAVPADEANAIMNPVYQDLKAQESRARVEVSTLRVKLAEQNMNLKALQQSVNVIPQVEANLAKLNRNYEVTKDRYSALVTRRERARLAQKVETNNSHLTFRVVDHPVVPLLPSGPNRPVLLTAVLVLGLAAGVGWSMLMFLLYPAFVDFKQLQRLVDMPVLGAISLQMTPEKRRKRVIGLTSFVLVMVLMFGSFGGVVMFHHQGSVFVRSVVAELKH